MMPVELERTIGKYRILDTLGSGGLATVYRAEDPIHGEVVALKVLHGYFTQEPGLVARFFQELAVVAQMRHKNIVAIKGHGEVDGHYWIAMELQEGSNLREAVRSPLALEAAASIVAEVAEALECAHEHGILHRNLKPSNVFLTPQGGARLSDFAFASLGEGARVSGNIALSTPMPSFMSPEQAGGRPLGVQSDVYSLGVLLYWLLTGTPPFWGEDSSTVLAKQLSYTPIPPSQYNPVLGPEVDSVVLRALAWTPPVRYQRPRDLVIALAAAQAAQPQVLSGQAEPTRSIIDILRDLATGVEREKISPPLTPAPALGLEASICLRCGRENRPELRFCAFCGYTLASRMPVSALLVDSWRRPPVPRSRMVLAAVLVAGVLALGAAGTASYVTSRPPELPPPTSAVTSASATGAWSMFRHDPGRTGYIPSISPAFKGEVRWEFPTNAPMLSSPITDAGTVYVSTGDSRILALDAANGKARWEYPTTGPVDSSPAVAGSLLYVGLRDGRLLALDAASGSLQWEYPTKNPIFASPAVVDGVVYQASGDGKLYTFDATTGALRWVFPTDGWISSSPAVDGEVVVFGSRDWWVYFVDAATGLRRFAYRTLASVEGPPVLHNGVVYVGAENRRFWALDATVRDTVGDRTVYWLRAQAFLWGFAPPPPPPKGLIWVARLKGRLIASPALAEGRVFLGTDTGVVSGFKADTGEQLWEFQTGGPVFSSPSVAGNTLYIGSDDGKLYALDVATGEKRWEFTTRGKVRSSPAITSEALYFTSSDGKLYALQ